MARLQDVEQLSQSGKVSSGAAMLAQVRIETKVWHQFRHPYFAVVDVISQERCEAIRSRWRARLRLCSHELRVWQPMVELRAMALQPREQMETWIKFASLCRKSGRHELTRTSLSKLLAPDSRLTTLPVCGHLVT